MTNTPHHMARMSDDSPRGFGPTYPTAAEALCLADDTWAHHDATDDFPCSACIAKAGGVL